MHVFMQGTKSPNFTIRIKNLQARQSLYPSASAHSWTQTQTTKAFLKKISLLVAVFSALSVS